MNHLRYIFSIYFSQKWTDTTPLYLWQHLLHSSTTPQHIFMSLKHCWYQFSFNLLTRLPRFFPPASVLWPCRGPMFASLISPRLSLSSVYPFWLFLLLCMTPLLSLSVSLVITQPRLVPWWLLPQIWGLMLKEWNGHRKWERKRENLFSSLRVKPWAWKIITRENHTQQQSSADWICGDLNA